jgi:hypothetical protein
MESDVGSTSVREALPLRLNAAERSALEWLAHHWGCGLAAAARRAIRELTISEIRASKTTELSQAALTEAVQNDRSEPGPR